MNKAMVKSFILDLFFPNRCPLCGNVIKWNIPYCVDCYENLPWTGDELCNGCGNIKDSCTCKNNDFTFSRCYAAFYYEGSARGAVIYLKNTKNNFFPDLVAKKIYTDANNDSYKFTADYVIPVPMSRRKQNSRGYNQAAIIGQAIADVFHIPMREDALKRHDSFVAQHTLSATMRKGSVENKYYCGNSDGLKGKTVILCDDVMTTGSTLDKCSRLLLDMGVSAVIIAVAATTIK